MTTNYGLAGGTLEPRVPQTSWDRWAGMRITQFRELMVAASQLSKDGYGVDADRILDALMAWRAGGDPPDLEDLS
jgi:hypothetical protein